MFLQVFSSDKEEQMLTEPSEDALEKARAELRRFRPRLVEMLGEDHEQTPEFQAMVLAVAKGRAAWMVISDYHPKDESVKQTGMLHGDARGAW